jgi:hypothetical protein
VQANALVSIQGNDQDIAEATRGRQVAQVADMQNVEAAVCQDQSPQPTLTPHHPQVPRQGSAFEEDPVLG